jgi:SAM-dependent methyltransferase
MAIPDRPGVADSTQAGPYNAQFYELLREITSASAAIVVPIVMNLIRPESVVDIGCGIGIWLRAFSEAGVGRVLGWDGAYVDRDLLAIAPGCFQEADLEYPLSIPGGFDLACSLEVAEHLTAAAGNAIVAALCAAAPVVMFSAAVPSQGGDHHINEQWPSYWIRRFETHGFRMIDALRPQIMADQRIAYYYRQNLMMFASEEGLIRHPALRNLPGSPGILGLEWVHISVHEAELRQLSELRELSDRATLRRFFRALPRQLVKLPRRLLRTRTLS